MCTQKNRLNETVILSTQNICLKIMGNRTLKKWLAKPVLVICFMKHASMFTALYFLFVTFVARKPGPKVSNFCDP